MNALLSFAYAMLLKDCFSALCTVGFDPYCGFFHAGRHGKPSLALDLMEEFRAVIADSVVLTLINNAMLTSEGFPGLARRMPADRRGPQALLPGLRAAQGDGGDAPGLRLQNELRPDAGGAGPHARRPRPRRHPRVHRLHRPLSERRPALPRRPPRGKRSPVVRMARSSPRRGERSKPRCPTRGGDRRIGYVLHPAGVRDLSPGQRPGETRRPWSSHPERVGHRAAVATSPNTPASPSDEEP